jgi:hypothetical protein
MLILLFALTGCGSSDTAITPSENVDSDATVLDNHYQLVIDLEAGTCELVNRNAEFNVTSCFDVRLVGFQIDPVKHLLYAKRVMAYQH